MDIYAYDQHIMGKIAGQFGAEIINYAVCVQCVDVYVKHTYAKFMAMEHERNFHFSTISGMDGQRILDQTSKKEWKSCFLPA